MNKTIIERALERLIDDSEDEHGFCKGCSAISARLSGHTKGCVRGKLICDVTALASVMAKDAKVVEKRQARVIDEMHQPRNLQKMLANCGANLGINPQAAIIGTVKLWLLDCQHLAKVEMNLDAVRVIQGLIDRLN